MMSCDHKIEKEFYENGSLKSEYTIKKGKKNGKYLEYFNNGNISSVKRFVIDKEVDSSLYYYENFKSIVRAKDFFNRDGSIMRTDFDTTGIRDKEGIIRPDGKAIGDWSYYDNDGILSSIKQFKIINQKVYLNQEIYLNKKGDTLYQGSHFFSVYSTSKDTITLGNSYNMYLRLYIPLYKNRDSKTYVLLGDGENFNSDFSNESIIKKDTFYNLTEDVKNQRWFEKDKFEYTVVFGKKYFTPGNKTLRGVLVEYFVNNKEDTIFNKKYFEKSFYVRDSILRPKNSLSSKIL